MTELDRLGAPGVARACSFEVRADLEELLERDLLGPWDGPDEELPPGIAPAERYLLGRLVPAARIASASAAPSAPQGDTDAQAELAETPDVEAEIVDVDPDLLLGREVTGVDDVDDSEVEPQATVRAGSRGAASMGLSFVVPTDITGILVGARWGLYERGPSEFQVTEQGRPRRVWKRRPGGGDVEIDLIGPADGMVPPDPRQDSVVLRWSIRQRGDVCVIQVALVNGQPELSSARDASRLYQVLLEATALDGHTAIFVPHNDPIHYAPESDEERRALALLHRGVGEFAHGRSCAAQGEVRPGERRAWRVTTTCFPDADVAMVQPGASGELPGLILDMQRLGSPELARDELVRGLAAPGRWLSGLA